MKKKAFTTTFLTSALFVLNGCNLPIVNQQERAKSITNNSINQEFYTASGYNADLPKISYNQKSQSKLPDKINESKQLIDGVGKTIACDDNAYRSLKGYKSPQNNFSVGSIFSMRLDDKHNRKTCYRIIDIYAEDESLNSFNVTYSFISDSSGDSAQKTVGFIKLNEKWYLKTGK